jgi:hypothetical protein
VATSMKKLAKIELEGEKNTEKRVGIYVLVSDGFDIKSGVEKNIKREIGSLAVYVMNNMKERKDGTD